MNAKDLVGTWRLVEVRAQPGEPVPWDAGLLTYTTDGQVSAFLENARHQPFASPAPEFATHQEKASVFDTFLAYAGRFRVVDDVVHHDLVHASMPNWKGTTLSRTLGWEGPRLTLTPLAPVGRPFHRRTVLWERV